MKSPGQRILSFSIVKLRSYLAYFIHKYSLFSSNPQGLCDYISGLHEDGFPGFAAAKQSMRELADYASRSGIELVAIVFPVFIGAPCP